MSLEFERIRIANTPHCDCCEHVEKCSELGFTGTNCRAVSHPQQTVVSAMLPSVAIEQQLMSLRSFHPQTATTARALSPLPDQLSLADTPAAEGILTPTHNTVAPR